MKGLGRSVGVDLGRYTASAAISASCDRIDQSVDERVAVFDVCNTLYKSNTTYDFIDYYLQSESVRKLALFRISRSRFLLPLWVILGRICKTDMFRYFAIGMLRGAREQYVRDKAVRFVEEVLSQRQNESALSLMQRLRNEGYTVVLASGSLLVVVEEIASVLKVREYFACSLESCDGLLTGRYLQDIRGEKDRVIAMRFRRCSDLAVVTDNREDVNLILHASRAWIICDRGKRGRWSDVISQRVVFLE